MPILKSLFGAAERQDGGIRIDQPIKYAISTQGGSYSGLGPLDTGSEKTRTRGKWSWAQYHRPIVLSNIDIAKNGGTEKVLDLVGQEMKEAEGDLKDMLGTDLFLDGTGNGALNFLGLVAAVDDGTNVATYGDITRSGNTWWQSHYNGSVGALTLAKLRTIWDAVTSGSDVPSLIGTTETVKSWYESLLTATPYYDVVKAKGPAAIEGSPLEVFFRGAPVIADEKCTAGYAYFLNYKYLKVFTLKHPKYPSRQDGFTVTDMREPSDQDGTVGYILNYFQLVNLAPRRSGVGRGITAPV